MPTPIAFRTAAMAFNSFVVILLILLPTLPPAHSSLSPTVPLNPFSHSKEAHQFNPALLTPILSNLGFHELAMAVPSLNSPILSSWSGPITIFAPSDDSIRTCPFCLTLRLLREHLVPGIFSSSYLSKLPFGTKLETASPGHCLTVTATNTVLADEIPSNFKIFIDGIEVTLPDLYNDGKIIIHGIQGFISPLPPASCSQEPSVFHFSSEFPFGQTLPLSFHDAILRLRIGGFSILSFAMRAKYAVLVGLQNMTVFALDDRSIFSSGRSYLRDVLFHVIPNRVLMNADLMNLPEGTVLPTLVSGQNLVVTPPSHGPICNSATVNYVPIKSAEVVHNSKIVVHSIFLPFPHLHFADLAMEGNTETLDGSASTFDGAASPVDFDDGL